MGLKTIYASAYQIHNRLHKVQLSSEKQNCEISTTQIAMLRFPIGIAIGAMENAH